VSRCGQPGVATLASRCDQPGVAMLASRCNQTGKAKLIKIRLVLVGKTKEAWIKQGIKHYQKLLKKHAKLELVEIKEEKITRSKDEKSILNSEGERILQYLRKDAFCIALDVSGDELTSEQFARFFEKSLNRGQSCFTFVLGGAVGISEEILQVCPVKLSLSRMTFTHEISRVIILEQIYRAFSILAGTKYHK
jgi:23S rRNA (pseudouridine1915-N3)-methyltransferase